MNTQDLVGIFDVESESIESTIRGHHALGVIFERSVPEHQRDVLRLAYLKLLQLSASYVQFTVPALRAAGEWLSAQPASSDREWGETILAHVEDESATEENGHDAWAKDDMRALGASEELILAPTNDVAWLYGNYLMEPALHPYAVLGAKGVLEHAAVRVANEIAQGMRRSGIPGAQQAIRFFDSHGALDVTHAREGDLALDKIRDEGKRRQIAHGAFVTGGTYRALVRLMLSPEAINRLK